MLGTVLGMALAWPLDLMEVAVMGPINVNFKYNTFCLTGTLRSMTRDQAAAQITSRGGYFTNSCNKSVKYMVIGDKPGGTKLRFARRSPWVVKLDEQDFVYALAMTTPGTIPRKVVKDISIVQQEVAVEEETEQSGRFIEL